MGLRHFARKQSWRLQLLRNQITSLVLHERIETTLPKAKELRTMAERVIGWGKDGGLIARRKTEGFLYGPEPVHKVFGELAARYAGRPGGYTRLLQTRRRQGDNAPMAFIEYIDRPGELRPAMPPQSGLETLEWLKVRRAERVVESRAERARREAEKLIPKQELEAAKRVRGRRVRVEGEERPTIKKKGQQPPSKKQQQKALQKKPKKEKKNKKEKRKARF